MNNDYPILKVLGYPVIPQMMMSLMLHTIRHCKAFQRNTMNKLKNDWFAQNKSYKASLTAAESGDEELERFETFIAREVKLLEPDGTNQHRANHDEIIDELTEPLDDLKDEVANNAPTSTSSAISVSTRRLAHRQPAARQTKPSP